MRSLYIQTYTHTPLDLTKSESLSGPLVNVSLFFHFCSSSSEVGYSKPIQKRPIQKSLFFFSGKMPQVVIVASVRYQFRFEVKLTNNKKTLFDIPEEND